MPRGVVPGGWGNRRVDAETRRAETESVLYAGFEARRRFFLNTAKERAARETGPLRRRRRSTREVVGRDDFVERLVSTCFDLFSLLKLRIIVRK